MSHIVKTQSVRHIAVIFAVFCAIMIATTLFAERFTAAMLKKQMINKCAALAFTLAEVIEEDADTYEWFVNICRTEDARAIAAAMETNYYKRVKLLLMKIRNSNIDSVRYLYTEININENEMMYILGGEPPLLPNGEPNPSYTAPGTKDAHMRADIIAYGKIGASIAESLEDTAYGTRLSAYAPIFGSKGQFLGLAGVDVSERQYAEIILILRVQMAVSITISIMFFAVAIYSVSGGIRRVMNTDALTKMPNKAHFCAKLKQRLKTGAGKRAASKEVYVVMADVDHFKKVNDTYGHEFGDKVLSAVAAEITASIRDSDCAARYGGEEFVICMGNADEDTTKAVMERIRSRVEQLRFRREEDAQHEDVTVTISLGAAQARPGGSVTEAIEMADKALYEAKIVRNTTILHTSSRR